MKKEPKDTNSGLQSVDVLSSPLPPLSTSLPFLSKKGEDKPPSISIPQDSDNIQESTDMSNNQDKTLQDRVLEDVPTTHYYQFAPQEDQHSNQQFPPEDGHDEQ
jgi:hypothetical protein